MIHASADEKVKTAKGELPLALAEIAWGTLDRKYAASHHAVS